MNYAEEDLYNADRQSFAFPLLYALLKKRLKTKEMDFIGDKVLKLAITAESEAARNSAKNFFCSYLMEVCYIFRIKDSRISINTYLLGTKF